MAMNQPREVVADALPELLPCPFCGSPASLYRATRAIHAHVTCSSEACEACGPALYSPEAAIEMWNKRATTPAASEGVEGLRQGNWSHPDGGRIVGWVVEPSDMDRMKADAFCLPREVAEALTNLRDAHRTPAASVGEVGRVAYPVGSDREVLLYLMQQFDGEQFYCKCGRSEPCADMDSADYLRRYLAETTPPTQQEARAVDDEMVERALAAFYGNTDWTRSLQRDAMKRALTAALTASLAGDTAQQAGEAQSA